MRKYTQIQCSSTHGYRVNENGIALKCLLEEYTVATKHPTARFDEYE